MKKKYGWFYDISGILNIERREIDGSSNNGDYHHHNWVGPYRTPLGAWREGMKILRAEISLAQMRCDEFRGQKPKG